MTKKILTYRETLMNEFNHPVDLEPGEESHIDYVGRNGAIVMFSFDDAKVEIKENLPEHEQRVWDMDDPTEVSEMKEFIRGVDDVKRKLGEFEAKVGANTSLYRLLKGIIDNDQAVIDQINGVDTAKDDWLKSIGLPGTSILD